VVAETALKLQVSELRLDEALRDAVRVRGYDVEIHVDRDEAEARREERAWLRRMVVAWPLGVVVMAISMAFPDAGWARWTAFALTTPVRPRPGRCPPGREGRRAQEAAGAGQGRRDGR
jgi:hypothetical protein